MNNILIGERNLGSRGRRVAIINKMFVVYISTNESFKLVLFK